MDCLIHEGAQMWIFSLSAVFSGMALESYTHWLFKYKTWMRRVEENNYTVDARKQLVFSIRTVHRVYRPKTEMQGSLLELSALLVSVMGKDKQIANAVVTATALFCQRYDLDIAEIIDEYRKINDKQ
jgi:hypothetical protein